MSLSMNALKRSFRCHSSAAMFPVGTCMIIGLLFILFDSGAGWIFLIAAGAALAVFCCLGARDNDVARLVSRRLVSKD